MLTYLITALVFVILPVAHASTIKLQIKTFFERWLCICRIFKKLIKSCIMYVSVASHFQFNSIYIYIERIHIRSCLTTLNLKSRSKPNWWLLLSDNRFSDFQFSGGLIVSIYLFSLNPKVCSCLLQQPFFELCVILQDIVLSVWLCLN